MFTDHMLFSGATELLGVLVLLYSFAMSIRVRSLNPILLHPASGSWTPLNKFYLSQCTIAARIHQINSELVRTSRRKNCNLFPAGRRASANGKEETSC